MRLGGKTRQHNKKKEKRKKTKIESDNINNSFLLTEHILDYSEITRCFKKWVKQTDITQADHDTNKFKYLNTDTVRKIILL